MYWKDAFIYTLRETPADAEVVSHQLMSRAGMIMKVASGVYNYLPLGLRVIRKIEDIIRDEMKTVGASELLMPAVIPSELWKESGRWDYYGKELLRITDRKNNEFCIGPTHEEVVVDVARRSVKSYRDLPLTLYQIQSKFRDEIRPRFGLMRGREFIMKDAYSFHETEESLDEMYWKMHNAYTNIFSKMGLTFRPVEADSGAIGGETTHEFHVLADSGEDKIIFCESCDYAANVEKAVKKIETEFVKGSDEPVTEVETPGKKTIEEVSNFLSITPEETIKMLIFKVDDEKLVGVIIRGDQELNEVKFRNFLKASTLEIPMEHELIEAGMKPGYLGALDFVEGVDVYADYSVKSVSRGVIGANKEDYHTFVSPERDLADLTYGDFGFADEGDTCTCGGTLNSCRGIEVGQVFKLEKKYSSSMNMNFLDANGKKATPTMGCYGIGVGRTAASAVEQNFDKDGIVWPISIAPYQVVILALDADKEESKVIVDDLHDTLEAQGIDTLVDDRKERPGVKFKDADLIGIPLQVVIGKRGIESGDLEVKIRKTGEKLSVPVTELKEKVIELVGSLA